MPDLLGEDAQRLVALGIDPEGVATAARVLCGALRSDRKVLFFGNGGSAADAQHLAAELVGRFEQERQALAAVALTTDTSALTAIANDFGFDHVFARQVEALACPGDVVVGISTSGSSPNVLNGIAAARRAGARTIGLCGVPGCQLCESVDVAIVAPAGAAAPVQEAHLVAEHALCRAVERAIVTFAGAGRSTPQRGSVASVDDLEATREAWRDAGLTMVWTNGCFDIIHAGHLSSLEAARVLGDVLVVGVNSDAAVRRLKGAGRPLMPATDRAALLAALRPVDYVVVFDEDTPEAVLARLRPDVHCKGADYADGSKPIPERALVESYGGRVEFLPLVPNRSTTGLVQAIRERNA